VIQHWLLRLEAGRMWQLVLHLLLLLRYWIGVVVFVVLRVVLRVVVRAVVVAVVVSLALVALV
jgi:hypothetical protein